MGIRIFIAFLALQVFEVTFGAECYREIAPPAPVVSIPAKDPRALLQQLIAIADQHGFKAGNGVNWDAGWFRARKTEGPSENYQIAVWLEWNIQHPGQELDVFMDYAKFHKYTGESDWQMICPNANLDTPVDLLKTAIRHLAGLSGVTP